VQISLLLAIGTGGFIGAILRYLVSGWVQKFSASLFLGALTTFSTFSLETVTMLQSGLWGRAAANIALNAALCITATITGMALFKRLYG